ncbi:MAG: hypothetical protein Q4G10_06705, partial [Bacteroidia bacterium]|nr:hypothetical protein [Bacteroidia bacterium]
MKIKISCFIAAICAIMTMSSCAKEGLTPDDLTGNPDLQAEVRFKTKSHTDGIADSTLPLGSMMVVKKGSIEGSSWFCANTVGKMVWEMAMISIYFQDIDTLKDGDTIKPARTMFGFIASSDSNNYTDKYKGE